MFFNYGLTERGRKIKVYFNFLYSEKNLIESFTIKNMGRTNTNGHEFEIKICDYEFMRIILKI